MKSACCTRVSEDQSDNRPIACPLIHALKFRRLEPSPKWLSVLHLMYAVPKTRARQRNLYHQAAIHQQISVLYHAVGIAHQLSKYTRLFSQLTHQHVHHHKAASWQNRTALCRRRPRFRGTAMHDPARVQRISLLVPSRNLVLFHVSLLYPWLPNVTDEVRSTYTLAAGACGGIIFTAAVQWKTLTTSFQVRRLEIVKSVLATGLFIWLNFSWAIGTPEGPFGHINLKRLIFSGLGVV
jgi:hypothetical protein